MRARTATMRDHRGFDPEEDWPERPLGRYRPLVTAAEGFPAFERLTLDARRAVWFWLRIFDPETPLVTEEARAAAGETWRDLLALKLEQGVAIAVAHSDFDPLGGAELHAAAHRHKERFEPLKAHDGFDLLMADHGARARTLIRLAAWPAALAQVARMRRRLSHAADPEAALRVRPGLGRWLAAKDGRIVWRAFGPPVPAPATHHQKIAVADGARAVIGGLDIDRRRWDDPSHRRPAPLTWRDVSVAVDGPVAVDIARHVAECWNDARERLGRDDLRRLEPPATDETAAEDAPRIRLSRTLSAPAPPDPTRMAPVLRARGLERDHLRLIGEAERLLYVETQFLRSTVIAKALARRAEEIQTLGLILVLPAAPEDVAFDGARDLGSRFGEHLQSRAIRRLRRAFGERLAVVSPARPFARETGDRSALNGAGIVYVHSKVMIADWRAALVSSANLNGRSLRWDTEAGVVARDPAAARALGRRVMETLLPEDAPASAYGCEEAPPVWAGIAAANAARPPDGRKGFLLPYDRRPAAAFGAPAPGLPEEMV